MVTKKTQSKSGVSRDRISEKYTDSVLMGSDNLSSVYAFCKSLRIKESSFYKHFNSFEALEDSIWKNWLTQTLDTLRGDSSYAEFSVREKLLSFYFTWFEILLSNRSFVTISLKHFKSPENFFSKTALQSLKKDFLEFADDLLKEGEETGEIPKRQTMINKSYPNGMWLQFLFLLNFWKDDNSSEFSDTDAAIEKSVNLSLDLIGRGPVDAMVDFAKFMYQRTV